MKSIYLNAVYQHIVYLLYLLYLFCIYSLFIQNKYMYSKFK